MSKRKLAPRRYLKNAKNILNREINIFCNVLWSREFNVHCRLCFGSLFQFHFLERLRERRRNFLKNVDANIVTPV